MMCEDCPACNGTGIDEMAVSCEGEPPVVCDLCNGVGEVDTDEADCYYAENGLDSPRDFDPWDVEISDER